jgi:hypothetical protein
MNFSVFASFASNFLDSTPWFELPVLQRRLYGMGSGLEHPFNIDVGYTVARRVAHGKSLLVVYHRTKHKVTHVCRITLFTKDPIPHLE